MLDTGTTVTLAAHSYRLEAPLAGSAYGLVWRARRVGSAREGGGEVALKFVNRDTMDCAEPRQRQRWCEGARQEAALLSALAPWDGRHIVRLLDQGVHAALPVLALELLDGDARAWVARRRAAGAAGDPVRALAWTAQVNQALCRVHQHGWRHLDVKPSNLLLAGDGAALKLTDFGTARPHGDQAPHDFAGTPGWQAPEQVFGTLGQGGATVYRSSLRSDYFALGAMLYYFVMGGLALRFCSECGHALREDQQRAARRLTTLHGAMPPTLGEDEAALFIERCAGALHPGAALLLLRALLQADPARRAPHALAIARMLAAARMPGQVIAAERAAGVAS